MKKEVLLVTFMAVAANAVAQSQEPVASELVLRATTRLVLLDVVVSDRSGRAVTTLSKDDFSVTEDEKPQVINSFSVHNSTSRSQPSSLPPELPPNVVTNRPDVIESTDNLAVLLLDGLNTPPQNQVYVKQQMLRFLAEHLDTGRQLAVVLLTDRLIVLQDFTSSPMLLKKALEQYRPSELAMARNGGAGDSPNSALVAPSITLPSQATGAVGGGSSDPTAPANAGGSSSSIADDIAYMTRRFEKNAENFSRDVRVSSTLAALQQITRYLAGHRGRKALLWFSTAFPIDVMGPDPDDLETSRSYGDQIRRTTNLLNDAHVAVYTIDASGLVGDSIADPSNSGRDASGRVPLTLEANKKLAQRDFARMSTANTLEQVALDTGGKFFHGNDIGNSIDVSLRDGASYYLLGYYPTNKKWDGKFRRVRVKVNQPGIVVRSRQGYFAIDSSQGNGNKDSLKNAVSTDVLPSTQVTFLARALPPQRKSDLVVEFVVDASTISFRTTASAQGNSIPVARQSCSLTFEVQAYSQDGNLTKAEVQAANGDLEAETYERVRKQGLPMKVPISLGPGSYLLHLGVRDNHTGFLGTAQLHIDIPAK